MGYAEQCEYWASMGFSGSDAADIAGSGVRPRVDEDEEEDAIERLVNRMLDDDFERELERKAG